MESQGRMIPEIGGKGLKYLIIAYDNYFNMPYVQNYEKKIKETGNEYQIVLWERDGNVETNLPNWYVFREKDGSNKLRKLLPFIKWSFFVRRILREHEYDRLIILTTIPGLLLYDCLLGKYRKKYWFDVRDFTYEYLPVYKKMVGSLVKHSLVTSISSEAFRSFLPDFPNLVLAHNITNDTKEEKECGLKPQKTPVTIGFVGGMQYLKNNKRLLSQFANHPGYLLKYAGKIYSGCDLKPFCQENGIKNAEFLPVYQNEQKPQIYQNIDMINSIYGNKTPIVRLALPNKLYDCILFKKPILVSKGTYLASIVEKYHLGLPVDIESDSIVEAVDNYIKNFDKKEFENGCAEFLERVKKENTIYQNMLKKFCS